MNVDQKKVSRVEIIGQNGRECVKYGEFTFSLQDDGKTLKVFVDKECSAEKIKKNFK